MSEEKKSEEKKTVEKTSTTKQVILEWVRDIAIAIVIALAISMIVKPTVVKESSMEPNFYANDYIFLSRLAYKFGGQPEKGDVIVFRTNSNSLLDDSGKHKLLIKRVIGVPGDKIRIVHGEVYINGEPDDQSYTRDGDTTGYIEDAVVPEGKLFCMGDNREVSIDSRSGEVGFIDQDTIVGKAVFRLLPLGNMGVIHNVYDVKEG
ncbi:MAG: signal peptidase I [Eubacterium sp.]|nr:signal peptidase I [Eubacterium sp.]